MEREITNLNRMILEESQIRSELQYKLDKAIHTKQYIVKTLELLKENLQILLESRALEIEQEEEIRREEMNIPSLSNEMFSILSLTNEIDKNLVELGETIDFSSDEIVVIPDKNTKETEALVSHLASEMAIRESSEKRNTWLQNQLRSLKQSLQSEISEREKLEEISQGV